MSSKALKTGRIGWIMFIKGPCDFRFIGAEPPCNKGEIDISLHWYHIVIGWQEREEVENEERA
jgi:hypothetical protein